MILTTSQDNARLVDTSRLRMRCVDRRATELDHHRIELVCADGQCESGAGPGPSTYLSVGRSGFGRLAREALLDRVETTQDLLEQAQILCAGRGFGLLHMDGSRKGGDDGSPRRAQLEPHAP
jgi:hypothetical protein